MTSLEERFQRLAAVWRAETACTSSSSDLVAHPALQEIVGMRPSIIPILLRELEKSARRASDLVLQILAYSGKGHFVVGPVDLSALVRELGGLLQTAASKASASIRRRSDVSSICARTSKTSRNASTQQGIAASRSRPPDA